MGSIQLINYVITYAPTKIRPYAFLLTGISPQFPAYHICAMSPESCLKWFDEIAKETKLPSPRDMPVSKDKAPCSPNHLKMNSANMRGSDNRARTKSKTLMSIETNIQKRATPTNFIDKILDQLTVEEDDTYLDLFADDDSIDGRIFRKAFMRQQQGEENLDSPKPPILPSRPSSFTQKPKANLPRKPVPPSEGQTKPTASPALPKSPVPTAENKDRPILTNSRLRERSKARTYTVEAAPKEFGSSSSATDETIKIDMTDIKDNTDPSADSDNENTATGATTTIPADSTDKDKVPSPQVERGGWRKAPTFLSNSAPAGEPTGQEESSRSGTYLCLVIADQQERRNGFPISPQ